MSKIEKAVAKEKKAGEKAVAAAVKAGEKALKDEQKRLQKALAGIEYPDGMTGKQKAAVKAEPTTELPHPEALPKFLQK